MNMKNKKSKVIKRTEKESSKIKFIRRRTGEVVAFDLNRIVGAVSKAFEVTTEGGENEARVVASSVSKNLNKLESDLVAKQKGAKFLPTVEQVQDLVEKELMNLGFVETAKKYILYRNKRTELRKAFGPVPEATKKLMEESSKYFNSPYSEFIFYRSYSRWNDKEGRRETWIESVDRYFEFMKENLGDKLKESEYKELRNAVLTMQVVPSMRLMWGAGNAARKSNAVVHVNTEIRVSYKNALSKYVVESNEVAPYKYMKSVQDAVKETVKEKLKIFNFIN
jgi:ribonucleoside-diphosphate reductase alpha chain